MKQETLSGRYKRELANVDSRVRDVGAQRLAKVSGVSLSTVWRVRRGDGYRPDPETVDALLAGLDELGVG